ncbi:MAG: hypothetical protein WBC89_03410 [Dehalococcoidia bacterium]
MGKPGRGTLGFLVLRYDYLKGATYSSGGTYEFALGAPVVA